MGMLAQQEKVIVLVIVGLDHDERGADGKGKGSRKSGREGGANLACINDGTGRGSVGYRLRRFLQFDKRLPNAINEGPGLALRSPLVDHPSRMNCARSAKASIRDGWDNIGAGRKGRSCEITLQRSRKGPSKDDIRSLKREELRI